MAILGGTDRHTSKDPSAKDKNSTKHKTAAVWTCSVSLLWGFKVVLIGFLEGFYRVLEVVWDRFGLWEGLGGGGFWLLAVFFLKKNV